MPFPTQQFTEGFLAWRMPTVVYFFFSAFSSCVLSTEPGTRFCHTKAKYKRTSVQHHLTYLSALFSLFLSACTLAALRKLTLYRVQRLNTVNIQSPYTHTHTSYKSSQRHSINNAYLSQPLLLRTLYCGI